MKLTTKDTQHLISQIAFLLASVLVFRSAWHLLDLYPISNEPFVLVLTLIVGLILCARFMHVIIKTD